MRLAGTLLFSTGWLLLLNGGQEGLKVAGNKGSRSVSHSQPHKFNRSCWKCENPCVRYRSGYAKCFLCTFWCTAPLIYISIYIFWWTLCSFWNFHLFLFLCDNSKLEVLFCLFYIFTVGICHFIKGGCCCEYTLVLLGFFWSPQRRIPKGRTCASLRLSPCSLQGFTLRKKYLLQKLRDGPGKILYWEVVRERVLKSTERFFNSGV